MKITAIRIRNFRCFHEADLEGLGQIVVVGGLNGVGKSTIADGISVCLTGTARGADTGRGLDELRRVGSRNRWVVELETDLGRITRTEGEGPGSKVQARVGELTGLSSETIRACLYSGELLRLAPRDRQALVLALARPAPIELPRELVDLVRSAGAAITGGTTLDRDSLERLYQDVFALRRTAGAEARGAGEAAPTPAAPHPSLAGKTIDELHALKSKALEDVRGLKAQHDAKVRQFEEAQERATSQGFDLVAARQALEDLGEPGDGEAIRARASAVIAEMSGLRAARVELVRDRDDAMRKHAEAAADQRAAEQALVTVKGVTGQCPHCRQTVSAEARQAMLDTLTREAKRTAKATQTADRVLADARQALAANDAEAALLRKRAEDSDAENARYEADQARRAELAATIARLEAEDPAADQAALEGLGRDVAALAEKVERYDRNLSMLDQYLGALRSAAESDQRRQRLVRAHDDLDRAVKLLDELRSQPGGGELEQFLEGMTSHLAAMGLDDVDLSPLVDRSDDPIVRKHPARMLSRVQQIEFGLAFQVAAARVTGLDLVIVDDFDSLDAIQSRAVQKLLVSSGVQAIVLQALTGKANAVEEFAALARRANTAGGCYVLVTSGPDGSSVEAPREAVA